MYRIKVTGYVQYLEGEIRILLSRIASMGRTSKRSLTGTRSATLPSWIGISKPKRTRDSQSRNHTWASMITG
jgi:hypothetical protein